MKDKWILAWKKTNQNKPYKNNNIYWIYIHELFNDAIIANGYAYTKCAIQRHDEETGPPPFKITQEVESAFKKAVIEKGISRYLIQGDKPEFELNESRQGLPILINRMKQYIEASQSVDFDHRRK